MHQRSSGTSERGASDLLFIAPLVLFVLGWIFIREARRVSIEGGYPLWSLATLESMTTYLVVFGLACVAVIAWTIVRCFPRKDKRSKPEDGV
jgi:hypothetical protein